jgi:hypothetical protein
MIRVQGAAAAGERLSEIAEAIRQNLAAAMEAEAQALEAEARRRCPADTGTLRDSIHAEVKIDGDICEAAIGSALPYAAPVELGALGRSPKPYLAPALKARRGALAQRMEQALQSAIRRKSN